MLEPFKDKNISFADTLYFGYRKTDSIKVRYQALIGGDDPIIMYLGRHSRWSYISDSWTDCDHQDKDYGNYFLSEFLDKNKIPPMGSNGFLVRTNIARRLVKDSFIHSDFIFDLINKGYNCFAKVKTSIVHNQPKFFANKARRIKRRINNEIKINYNYGLRKWDLIKTGIYICIILPVFYDALRGFIKKPDLAWIFHPIACFGELFQFAYYNIKSQFFLKV